MPLGKTGTRFMLGNALLALALLMLFFLGALWERLGVLAMALWMLIAGLGFYFVTTDKTHSGPHLPD